MIRAFAFPAALAFSAALAVPAAGASQTPSVTDALPRGAHLISSTQISGYPGRFAVTYQTTHPFVGLVQVQATQAREFWHRRLAAEPLWLRVPGPAGVFFAGVETHDGLTHLLAYALTGTHVSSAIANSATGDVAGDEGVRIVANGFRLLNRDTQHVGSVQYRTRAQYRWNGAAYALVGTTRVPDYPPSKYPMPNGVVHTVSGDTILIRLQIADTEQKRETGLMNVKTMDPDSGMVFVWPQLVHESFWMANTYIPLTVAFLSPDGHIQEMQDMQPLTLDYHTPAAAYQYAIEANQGFFQTNGIHVGDRVELHLGAPGTPKKSLTLLR